MLQRLSAISGAAELLDDWSDDDSSDISDSEIIKEGNEGERAAGRVTL